MSFDPRFTPRWEQVIGPAISDVHVNDTALAPHRVDMSVVHDAIVTEIMSGIANDILVVADITTLGEVRGRPVRNANVMYELGIAHAVRTPAEVLILRSDNDSLAFDVSGIRVRPYDPDGAPMEARKTVATAIGNALKEVDALKLIAVENAARSLDSAAFSVLFRAVAPFTAPPLTTPGEILSNVAKLPAIVRLLEIGAIETDFRVLFDTEGEPLSPTALEEEAFVYRITNFGRAVLGFVAQKQGLTLDVLAKLRGKGPRS